MRKAGTLQKMSSPVAVLLSDVHYSLKTLKEAEVSMLMAIDKAEELDIPLIIAGDLHDTKANLRGECTNAMVKTFSNAKCSIELLIGNHCRINEKSQEHSLNFLEPYCNFIVNEPRKFSFEGFSFYMIPYYFDVQALKEYLSTIPAGSTLIMHQGLKGSHAGEYILDRTALDKESVANFRVISGHYHRRQSIQCSKKYINKSDNLLGWWDYIGNPYTTRFDESEDPEKGFQVLYDDGSLKFIPTNLRKHVKIEIDVTELEHAGGPYFCREVRPNDILWVVIHGPSDKLATITKESLGINQPFRLELTPTDAAQLAFDTTNKLDFDSVIDGNAGLDNDRKARLKTLWKDLIDEDPAS